MMGCCWSSLLGCGCPAGMIGAPMLAGHGVVAMAGVLASRDDGVWGTVAVVNPWILEFLPAGFLGCSRCGALMDPSAAWSSCQQS